MNYVLAIDPGPTQSAFVVYESGSRCVVWFGKCGNDQLLDMLHKGAIEVAASSVVIEKVESFGMAVGAEVFETVYWSGRFAEAAYPTPVDRIGRKAVKLALCGNVRAKDANIRQALIDRFGGPSCTKKGGELHGVSKDVWSALAVAVTWSEKETQCLTAR